MEESCKKLLTVSILAALLSEPDQDGRWKTKNGHGYVDSRLNSLQLAFLEAAEKANVPDPNDPRIPLAVDFGAGYGILALEAAKRGINILFIDSDPTHALIAETRLQREPVAPPGKILYHVARLPYQEREAGSEPSEKERELMEILKTYRVTVVNANASVIYVSDVETPRLLKFFYDIVPSKNQSSNGADGQVFIGAVSPFSNLFPDYEPTFLERRKKFFEDPESEPFPSYIESVKADPRARPNPDADYERNYTDSMHLLDPAVYSYHARKTGFKVKEAKFERRDYPEWLVYKGEQEGVGEVARVILEKP